MAHYLKFFKSYFDDFIEVQDKKTKIKIISVINLVIEWDRIPGEYLKKIKGSKNIYEIRINSQGTAIRIFCIFDMNTLVLLNAFRKKSRRTPLREIRLAQRLSSEYYENKPKNQKS